MNIDDKILNFFESFNTTQNVLETDYTNIDKEFVDNLNLNSVETDEDNVN